MTKNFDGRMRRPKTMVIKCFVEPETCSVTVAVRGNNKNERRYVALHSNGDVCLTPEQTVRLAERLLEMTMWCRD